MLGSVPTTANEGGDKMQTLRRMTTETETALELRLRDLRELRALVADHNELEPHVEPLPNRSTPIGEIFCDADGNVIYVPHVVRVIRADGSSEVVPQSHFTGTGERTTRRATRTVAPVAPQTARIALDPRDIAAIADGSA
jgi:hypothetical protein